MTTFIPEHLPILRKGKGQTPEKGGCLMQVASFLHDGSWSDRSPCVAPFLRQLAIFVNDWTSDEERHLLAPLAVDLIGTAVEDRSAAVTAAGQLGVWCSRRVAEYRPEWSRAACKRVEDAAEAYWDRPCSELADTVIVARRGIERFGVAWTCDPRGALKVALEVAWCVDTHDLPGNRSQNSWEQALVIGGSLPYDTVMSVVAGAGARRDVLLRELLTDAIAEHRRLTGSRPAPVTEGDWRAVCELTGVAG